MVKVHIHVNDLKAKRYSLEAFILPYANGRLRCIYMSNDLKAEGYFRSFHPFLYKWTVKMHIYVDNLKAK